MTGVSRVIDLIPQPRGRLAPDQNGDRIVWLNGVMPAILFRCPNTGSRVQGWIAEDVTDAEEDTYEPVTCLACQRVHLVNPKTEKVLGSEEG
jgi:hypothetical protein